MKNTICASIYIRPLPRPRSKTSKYGLDTNLLQNSCFTLYPFFTIVVVYNTVNRAFRFFMSSDLFAIYGYVMDYYIVIHRIGHFTQMRVHAIPGWNVIRPYVRGITSQWIEQDHYIPATVWTYRISGVGFVVTG